MEEGSKAFFRGFIAVKISKEVEGSIGRYQESLRRTGFECKWVKPSNIHLTLSFLGNVENDTAIEIMDLLKTSLAGYGAFNVKASSVGVFPNVKRPSVLWVGLSNVEELRRLKNIVENSVSRFGFKPEERDFKPHLTIGRFKARCDQAMLEKIIDRDRNKEFGEFSVDRVIFFRSDLKPTGPVYSEVASIALRSDE